MRAAKITFWLGIIIMVSVFIALTLTKCKPVDKPSIRPDRHYPTQS